MDSMNSTQSYAMTSEVPMMTYSSTPNVTSNVTDRARRWRADVFVSVESRTVILVLMCIIAILGITLNVGITGTIFSQERMRKSIFSWCILGLCFTNLQVGVIVVPLTISRLHKKIWLHGFELCKAVMFLEGIQFAFGSMFLISLNLYCILRMMRGTDPVKQRHFVYKRLLPYVLFSIPWVYIGVVCFPLLIEGELVQVNRILKTSNTCFYAIKREFFFPIMTMTVLAPFCVLLITSITCQIYYKVKIPHWQRISQVLEDDDDSQSKVRSSTIATSFSSLALLVSKLPNLTLVIIYSVCRSRSCFPSITTYLFLYLWIRSSIIFTVLPWIISTDIRQGFLELLSKVLTCISSCCGSRGNEYMLKVWTKKKSELLDEADS